MIGLRIKINTIKMLVGICLALAMEMACSGSSLDKIPAGHEIAAEVAPDGYSRGFVWRPELTGLGATVSQPYQVWIQYLQGSKKQRLIFQAEDTAGVQIAWRGPRTLEICYGPSHIYHFINYFEYGEQHSQQLYEIEVLLRRSSVRTLIE